MTTPIPPTIPIPTACGSDCGENTLLEHPLPVISHENNGIPAWRAIICELSECYEFTVKREACEEDENQCENDDDDYCSSDTDDDCDKKESRPQVQKNKRQYEPIQLVLGGDYKSHKTFVQLIVQLGKPVCNNNIGGGILSLNNNTCVVATAYGKPICINVQLYIDCDFHDHTVRFRALCDPLCDIRDVVLRLLKEHVPCLCIQKRVPNTCAIACTPTLLCPPTLPVIPTCVETGPNDIDETEFSLTHRVHIGARFQCEKSCDTNSKKSSDCGTDECHNDDKRKRKECQDKERECRRREREEKRKAARCKKELWTSAHEAIANFNRLVSEVVYPITQSLPVVCVPPTTPITNPVTLNGGGSGCGPCEAQGARDFTKRTQWVVDDILHEGYHCGNIKDQFQANFFTIWVDKKYDLFTLNYLQQLYTQLLATLNAQIVALQAIPSPTPAQLAQLADLQARVTATQALLAEVVALLADPNVITGEVEVLRLAVTPYDKSECGGNDKDKDKEDCELECANAECDEECGNAGCSIDKYIPITVPQMFAISAKWIQPDEKCKNIFKLQYIQIHHAECNPDVRRALAKLRQRITRKLKENKHLLVIKASSCDEPKECDNTKDKCNKKDDCREECRDEKNTECETECHDDKNTECDTETQDKSSQSSRSTCSDESGRKAEKKQKKHKSKRHSAAKRRDSVSSVSSVSSRSSDSGHKLENLKGAVKQVAKHAKKVVNRVRNHH